MSLYVLTSSWQKIANSGSSVDIQNQGSENIYLVTSNTVPASGADGEAVYRQERRSLSLTADLYAMCPEGIATVEVMGSLNTATSTFAPINGKTVALLVGPVATTAPVALPPCEGSSYRVHNAASSASPVTWKISTSNAMTPTIPTAYSTAGAGGTPGDKSIEPGGVETIGLTQDQQVALAAGTLYLSAICPAAGSATISITPGTGS